jgi:hypothetical protein
LRHRNINKNFKEKFESRTKTTFNRHTTKDGCTWNVTHNTESAAVWNLKIEQWGSPLVQGKYQGEKACDKRQRNNNNNNNKCSRHIYNHMQQQKSLLSTLHLRASDKLCIFILIKLHWENAHRFICVFTIQGSLAFL